MASQVTRVVAPIRQQAVESLRRAIAEQILRPGTRLVERDLCEQLQVSRGLLREGLRQLETEGLLTRDSRGRLIVASISLEQARGVYEVRATLEGMAGRLFAERATDEDVRRLRGAYRLVAEAARDGCLSAFLAAKDRFYDVLLEGAGNDALRTVLRTLYWRITLLRRTSVGRPGRLEQSLQELHAIVDAVARRDAAAAEECCVAHVVRACEAALGDAGTGGAGASEPLGAASPP